MRISVCTVDCVHNQLLWRAMDDREQGGMTIHGFYKLFLPINTLNLSQNVLLLPRNMSAAKFWRDFVRTSDKMTGPLYFHITGIFNE